MSTAVRGSEAPGSSTVWDTTGSPSVPTAGTSRSRWKTVSVSGTWPTTGRPRWCRRASSRWRCGSAMTADTWPSTAGTDGPHSSGPGRGSRCDGPTGAPISRPLGPDSQSTTFLYAEFRPDRNEIVGYFSNGALHSWDLDPASWVRRACAIAGRDMTPEEWRRVLPARPYRHVCPG